MYEPRHFKLNTEPILTQKTLFTQMRDTVSLSPGWKENSWVGWPSLSATFGGDEIRFAIKGTQYIRLTVATEPYMFVHIYIDGRHVAGLGSEIMMGRLTFAVSPEGSQVRIVRTAVSSGPFYVDVHLLTLEMEESGQVMAPLDPVPASLFSIFGDSISGNCCIGPDGPYDPHGLSYGSKIAERFGWQLVNASRDGSALCVRPFENPLAADRIQPEVIDCQPDYLFIFYGTNDIRAGVDVNTFEIAFNSMLRRFVQGLPDCRIVVSGLLWNDMATREEIRIYSNTIKSVSEKYQLPFCDPYDQLKAGDFDDGVHPNQVGQLKLTEFFGKFMEKIWPELLKEVTSA